MLMLLLMLLMLLLLLMLMLLLMLLMLMLLMHCGGGVAAAGQRDTGGVHESPQYLGTGWPRSRVATEDIANFD
eukprot:COSAG03_NODE_858_length_5603_cov_3.620276_6_plen_73_part_00